MAVSKFQKNHHDGSTCSAIELDTSIYIGAQRQLVSPFSFLIPSIDKLEDHTLPVKYCLTYYFHEADLEQNVYKSCTTIIYDGVTGGYFKQLGVKILF